MSEFHYTVIRRKRRTASIVVYHDNTVQVIVPKRFPQYQIKEMLDEKTGWILKKIAYNQQFRPGIKPRKIADGETALYLGKECRLEIASSKRSSVSFFDEENTGPLIRIDLARNPQDVSKAALAQMEKWYRTGAEKILSDRVRHYSEIIGVTPGKITVKKLKRRWGSCASNGNISFNWKIIMAPMDIVDSVVVHELSHLVHLNHSRDFWNLVERILPGSKEQKNWLRKNGRSLEIS